MEHFATQGFPALSMGETFAVYVLSIKTLRAELHQIFRVNFWKIDDFINSFRLHPTFSIESFEVLYEIESGKL